MVFDDRVQYILALWYRQRVEQRLLLEDVPYENLRPEYREGMHAEAVKIAKRHAIAPFVMKRNGKKVRIW